MSMAAGCFGSPGMVTIAPVRATRKPAPADSQISRTVRVKPSGRPSTLRLSDREYCVFAIHTGVFPNPAFVKSSIFFIASGRISTFAAP